MMRVVLECAGHNRGAFRVDYFFYSFGQAKIEANGCGAADAVMLDVDGFVSETNATNLFMVKNGVLMTPATGSCLPDITRWADGGSFCFVLECVR